MILDRANGGAGARAAFRFVLAMGIVNLFADVVYEGGASVNGPFLGSLGATAAAISIVAGLGEFLGYALRALFGWMADRTGRHWPLTFLGYGVQLLAVPAIALAPGWRGAAALVVAERVGRAIRKPTVEAMLSYSTGWLGRGWVYGLNTALDEIGATLGPLLMAAVLLTGRDERFGYALLLAPTVLAFGALTAARIAFPVPADLERGSPPTATRRGFTRAYWLYTAAGGCFAGGLMSFELVSFHLATRELVGAYWIPTFLALATAGGIVASLVLGRLFDRHGIGVVVAGVLIAAAFPPLVFLGGAGAALAGLMLWGVGYATQDTLLKALIATVLPEGRRSFAFGLFYVGYGSGWLVGSVTVGVLYARSLTAVVAFAMTAMLLSVPLFLLGSRSERR